MVDIEVKQGIKYEGFSAFIKFKYSDRYVNLMRSLPTRYWHPGDLMWEIPYSDLNLVIDRLSETEYKIVVNKDMYIEKQDIHIPDTYVFKTKPFQHQIEGVEYGLNHDKFLLGDEQGCGKALSLDTKVYTPYGYKLMHDIQVGDYVFNKQGKPVKVLNTYDFDSVNMYKITFADDTEIECCEDHLWEINTRTGKQVVDTKWLVTNNKLKDSSGYLYSTDVCNPVDFAPQSIPMNPYYYGRSIDIKSYNAYIADEYKYNTLDVRYAVVKGIVERCVDLHVTISKNVISMSCRVWSERLANDLQYMFESLGCVVYTQIDENYFDYVYNLQIETNDYSKFVKDATISQSYRDTVRNIVKIESIGEGSAKCITVDDKDGLYLIDHFIVTHNTKQIIDLACIKKQMYGYKHCLVIACVNGLKYNWQDEVGVHSDERAFILGSYLNKKGQLVVGSNERRLDDLKKLDKIDSYFIITNIETLRYNVREKIPCKSKAKNGAVRYKTVVKFPIVEEIQKLVKNKQISMIAVDEIHRCFAGKTKVLTDKGIVPIKQIVEEQTYKVATKLDNNDIAYVSPTNYWTMPKQYYLMEIHVQKQYEWGCHEYSIQCTPNHKFLTKENKYEEIQHIEIGALLYNDYVVTLKQIVSYDDYVYDLEIPETHNYILNGNIVVHNCKDSTSLQGKALLSLNAESLVAMTGTPLMNNAVDLYAPLKFIGKEQHTLFQFKGHYCIFGGFGNHQVVGYKNLPELQAVLDKCMLRRLKSEVLDLPDKIYINDYVEMSPNQIKIYNSVLEDIRQNIDKVKISPNPLTMLIRLRQCTGNPELLSSTIKGSAKYDRMLELIEEVVQNGKKAIVFSNWTDVLNPAYQLLVANGYSPALYTGENKDDREAEKHRFKTDASCKVICGTIGAMGTGLTLTEATTIIFLDEPWNRAIKDQAEDRAHRIGTSEKLTIITLLCKNTIDEKINQLVYRKGKMSDIIVDKEEDLFKNPNVLNYLLS